MKKSLLVALALAATLSACDNHPAPQTQYVQQPAPQYSQYPQGQYPQQAPVVVQQHDGIGTGTALVGAAAIGTAAYLAGKANADKPATTTTNVYRPTTTVSAPAPARPVIQAPVAQAAPAPAPKQTFNPVAAKSMQTVTAPKTSFSAPSSSSSFKPSAVSAKRR